MNGGLKTEISNSLLVKPIEDDPAHDISVIFLTYRQLLECYCLYKKPLKDLDSSRDGIRSGSQRV